MERSERRGKERANQEKCKSSDGSQTPSKRDRHESGKIGTEEGMQT
jgi:hypothetical protein